MLDGGDIARGLETWKNAWPPSLPEFQEACRPARTVRAHQLFALLPKPKCDIAKARGQIAAMKAAMRGPLPPVTPWQEIHGMRAYA